MSGSQRQGSDHHSLWLFWLFWLSGRGEASPASRSSGLDSVVTGGTPGLLVLSGLVWLFWLSVWLCTLQSGQADRERAQISHITVSLTLQPLPSPLIDQLGLPVDLVITNLLLPFQCQCQQQQSLSCLWLSAAVRSKFLWGNIAHSEADPLFPGPPLKGHSPCCRKVSVTHPSFSCFLSPA